MIKSQKSAAGYGGRREINEEFQAILEIFIMAHLATLKNREQATFNKGVSELFNNTFKDKERLWKFIKTQYAREERGIDGGKRIKDFKRHIVVDIFGNLLYFKAHAVILVTPKALQGLLHKGLLINTLHSRLSQAMSTTWVQRLTLLQKTGYDLAYFRKNRGKMVDHAKTMDNRGYFCLAGQFSSSIQRLRNIYSHYRKCDSNCDAENNCCNIRLIFAGQILKPLSPLAPIEITANLYTALFASFAINMVNCFALKRLLCVTTKKK